MISNPKLFWALYPFGAGAMAVNLFFASLLGTWIGWRALTPIEAVIGGVALGIPVTCAFKRHIQRLMEQANVGN